MLVEDRATEHVRTIAKQIRDSAPGESPNKHRVRCYAKGVQVTVSYAITDPDSGTPSESHFTGFVYTAKCLM